MMNRLPLIAGLIVSISVFNSPHSNAQPSLPIVEEVFADGNRSTQTPPLGSPPYASLQWYTNNPSYVTSIMGEYRLAPWSTSTPPISVTTWACIAPQGSPINLAVGDSIALTFDYKYTKNWNGTTNLFRFGLFNGGSAPRQVDGANFDQSTLQGYVVMTNSQIASATGSTVNFKNNAVGAPASGFSSSGTGNLAAIGATFASIDAATTKKTAQLTVTRNASDVTITVTLDMSNPATVITRTMPAGSLTSFDTIGFYQFSTGNASGQWVAIGDVGVDLLHDIRDPVIANDQFTDANRTAQTPALATGNTPYSSLQWFASPAATVAANTTGLTFTPGTGVGLWTYFAPSGNPVALQTGEAIQVTFDYKYSQDFGGIDSKMLRLCLYNGGSDTRSTADGVTAYQSTLSGYTVGMDVQTAQAEASVVKRKTNTAADRTLVGGAAANLIALTTDKICPTIDATNALRTCRFTITNKGTHVEIRVNQDISQSAIETVMTDNNPQRILSFDMFALYAYTHHSANASLRMTNVKIEHLPVALPAFTYPTSGGAGGRIITVTNLNDSGAGSLRDAVSQQGARIIQFAVGGEIDMATPLEIHYPLVTIDGSTAPSPGITLLGDKLVVDKTHDVILRHLRIHVGARAGNSNPDNRDGIGIQGPGDGTRCASSTLVENCSVLWSIDEGVQIWGKYTHDIVVRNCIIAQGLKSSIHPKGDHSCGLLAGYDSQNVTVQGNLFAHNSFRNPVLGGSGNTLVVNNLIYNPGFSAFHVYPTDGNFSLDPTLATVVNNVLIKGPSSTSSPLIDMFYPDINLGSLIYFSGNLGPSWNVDEPANTPPFYPGHAATPPVPLGSIVPYAASLVESTVLSTAGARPANRDSYDTAIINSVVNRNGAIINTPPDTRLDASH